MKNKNYKSFFLIIVLFTIGSVAQNLEKQERIANTYMREANKLYHNSNYSDAEVAYKKSVATYPANPKAIYNLANTMIKQKRYKEAIKQYDYLAKNTKSNKMKAESFHNIGNANMGLNDFQKAADAYKNALRINPKDEETRYNLAYAQELLKQQQQQNKDNKNNQNKDKKDDNNKNQKNKNQDNKDQKNQENENQDKKDEKNQEDNKNDQDKKESEKEKQKDEQKPQNKDEKNSKQKKQQLRLGKISPQQAKQLLEAMQNEENKTQEKINAKRIKGKPVKTEKDW